VKSSPSKRYFVIYSRLVDVHMQHWLKIILHFNKKRHCMTVMRRCPQHFLYYSTNKF
jgi:hypothetical protein